MLMGYNNDVGYKGLTIHVQTEDLGLRRKKIITQVFRSGAILGSSTQTYTDEIVGLEGQELNRKIRSKMKEMHKQAFRNIKEGKYDQRLGIESTVSSVSSPTSKPKATELEITIPERFQQQADEEKKAARKIEKKEAPVSEEKTASLSRKERRDRRKKLRKPVSAQITKQEDNVISFSPNFAFRGFKHDDTSLIKAIRAVLR